jgi:hypothetical protein
MLDERVQTASPGVGAPAFWRDRPLDVQPADVGIHPPGQPAIVPRRAHDPSRLEQLIGMQPLSRGATGVRTGDSPSPMPTRADVLVHRLIRPAAQ